MHRNKQRKWHCIIRVMSDDVDNKDDDLITPYTFQDFRTKCKHHIRTPPVEACVPICAIVSKKSEKYPPQGI